MIQKKTGETAYMETPRILNKQFFFQKGENMKKKLTLLAVLVLTLAIAFTLSVSADAPPENGFYEDDGEWYYYRNGEMVTNEIISYGKYLYGFSEWGGMYNDTSFFMRVDQGDEDYRYVYYRAKPGGPLYVNEWYWNM